MAVRTVEDHLREEYFTLLPDVRRVVEELETVTRHRLLALSGALDKYEGIVVKSRVKDCESALDALRRRQESAIFDPGRAGTYTLTALNDLAGVRVMAFPRMRLGEANRHLREQFPSWTSDPIPSVYNPDEPLAFKYHGYCNASTRVRGELQIVPLLIGLFWQVEHSTIYKPSPKLKGVVREPTMQDRTRQVEQALRAFEDEFERLVQRDPLGSR
jgi:hypothetical protein